MHQILIQGEYGSFHHEAAEKLFGNNIEIVPCSTFGQIFDQLDNTNFGLVAIENSLYGSINEVYDLLERTNVRIFAETELSIHQNLIVTNGTVTAKNIREIYSHPVALAQCSDYLNQNFPFAEKIEFEDTAAAVRHITNNEDSGLAAIASKTAAKIHNAKILAENIEDHSVNFTRFVAITKNSSSTKTVLKKTKIGKASMILTTDHTPGALYEALGVFVSHQINLTKLQSRPIIGEKWHYRFYLDFEADEPEAKLLITDLENIGNTVTLLGIY